MAELPINLWPSNKCGYLSALPPWTKILKAVAKNKATIFEKFVTPYSVTIYGSPSAEVIETARIGGVDIKESSLLLRLWIGLFWLLNERECWDFLFMLPSKKTKYFCSNRYLQVKINNWWELIWLNEQETTKFTPIGV